MNGLDCDACAIDAPHPVTSCSLRHGDACADASAAQATACIMQAVAARGATPEHWRLAREVDRRVRVSIWRGWLLDHGGGS